jgi:F0F1-type ATP synthase membrane subunit b/b'
METVQAIFTQLGVDSSLAPQFVIVCVVFFLAQFLFLGRLQEVLETREEKTVKLENSADETIEKVSRMKAEYKAKMDEAQRLTLKDSTEKKQKITHKFTDQYKQAEKEVGAQVDASRNNFAKEVSSNREQYMAEADALAQSLVNKILQ